MRETREELETAVATRLAERFPEVEVVDVEVRGAGAAATLTVFIDRAGGVDLDLCAAVSLALDDLRDRYTLEVSSPGLDRRLRKPHHFAAAVGEEVAVRLLAPREGRRNFRGRLTAADESSISLDLGPGGVVVLPLAGIATAHVVYHFDAEGGHQ